MKNIKIYIIPTLFLLISAFTTTTNTFPSVELQTMEGETVNINEYVGQGKITVVSFWATWCSPCKKELDAVSSLYKDWQEKYDMQFIAITIDNERALAKVPAIISDKGWKFTVLSDVENKMQKELKFQTIPQTFLVDQNGNIVYKHNGYSPGDELELATKMEELTK